MNSRIAPLIICLIAVVNCVPENGYIVKETEQPASTVATTEATKRFHIPGLERIKDAAETIRDTMLDFAKERNKTAHANPMLPSNIEENNNSDKKEVCYDRVGCFSMEEPWKSTLRPIRAPLSPEKINTFIRFYNRQSPKKEKLISLYPEVNIGNARIDPKKVTVFIIHGFSSDGNATWMMDMKDAYLRKLDANVMLVDWGEGAKLLNYLQVAGNTRVVGKLVGMFLQQLVNEVGVSPSKVHLIGHSLGAQICSYITKQVPHVARLTALDPAQPGFEGYSEEVRLDKGDAEFVDVIHTDAKPIIPLGGFGTMTPSGHVDFYMNGGFEQPGCIPPVEEMPVITNILDLAKYPVELIAKMVSCPHGRAYQYLIEAFNETTDCIFWGHKTNFENVFKSVTNTVTQGLITGLVSLHKTCTKDTCVPLGFATRLSPLRGSFVVTTNPSPPFCIPELGIPPEIPENPSAPKRTSGRSRQKDFFGNSDKPGETKRKSVTVVKETMTFEEKMSKPPSVTAFEDGTVKTVQESVTNTFSTSAMYSPRNSKPNGTLHKESQTQSECTEPMQSITSAPKKYSTPRKRSPLGSELQEKFSDAALFFRGRFF